MVSKTHIKDIEFGDFLIRLYADPWDNGEYGWVDFRIHEYVGNYLGETRRFFNKKGWTSGPDPEFNPDEAEVTAEGFVKWDGCTQFDVSSIHVDHREDLEGLFAAILETRKQAAMLLSAGTADIQAEYNE